MKKLWNKRAVCMNRRMASAIEMISIPVEKKQRKYTYYDVILQVSNEWISQYLCCGSAYYVCVCTLCDWLYDNNHFIVL